MRFFKRIFRPEDFDKLFADFLNHLEDCIDIGERADVDLDLFIKFMEKWTKRIDYLTRIDKSVHGRHTKYTAIISRWRAFTFRELAALFNKAIDEKSFPFYPVFSQLQPEGGINFDKQRFYFLTQYNYDREDYLRILEENGFSDLISFFLADRRKRARLRAMLPYNMLMMHVYVCAATGWGKSTLLMTILYHIQKRYKKHSIVLIDPHGSLAKAVYHFKLNKNPERVIYVDPFFKAGQTPTFNLFQLNDRSMQNIVHVVEQNILAFEELLNAREGGKITTAMVDMLEKCMYFLLSRNDSNILDLYNLLKAEEPILTEAIAYDSFFNPPYDKPNNKTREGLKFRIGRMLNSPVLRNLLVGKNTFNLEAAVNSNKVVIFNLGGLGQMTSVAIGKLVLASLKSIVLKRDKNGPKHTFLVIDEAHNFVTRAGSFEYLLSQLRGFGLHGIFATQFVEQLGDQAISVKENTAIKILANEDTDSLKKMITPPKDIRLDQYDFLLKVRHKTVVKFRSPDILIKNPKSYKLNSEEIKELDIYQLKHYYKPTQDRDSFIAEEPEDDPITPDDLGGNMVQRSNLKPPFTLHIEEE